MSEAALDGQSGPLWPYETIKIHMPKASSEQDKTFAKSNLVDLCTYLNALQNPDILHSYFNIRFFLAGVLSNCGCLLYYKSM